MTRQTIVDEILYEEDVRPGVVYSRLRKLAIESAQIILTDGLKLIEVACPACNSVDREDAFIKYGYCYLECCSCGTLYISPRPDSEAITWYLQHSPIAKYRCSDTFQQELLRHRSEMVQSRVEWVISLCQSTGLASNLTIVDVQERYPAILENLVNRLSSPVYAVMPLWAAGDLRSTVSANKIEDLTDLDFSQAQIVTAFDVVEHIVDPVSFVQNVYNVLSEGGYFTLTTRASSGFDVQALWGRLDNIFPLEHINLISTQGMNTLLERPGFEVLEMSTPGQLDVQVVSRSLGQSEDWVDQRLLRLLALNGERNKQRDLQHFLQKHLLSSHMRVVACKR